MKAKTSIRLSISFWNHPKTVKLQRALGLEGIRSLQILWLWSAANRPDGVLKSLDEEDIECAAKWEGETGVFVSTLLSLGWIDGHEGEWILHGWTKHNPCRAEPR